MSSVSIRLLFRLLSICILPLLFLQSSLVSPFKFHYHQCGRILVDNFSRSLSTRLPCIASRCDQYETASRTRVIEGHDAAVSLYRSLLTKEEVKYDDYANQSMGPPTPNGDGDWSASLWIASSSKSPHFHDAACPLPKSNNVDIHSDNDSNGKNNVLRDIQRVKKVLRMSKYDHTNVRKLFFGDYGDDSHDEVQNGSNDNGNSKNENNKKEKIPASLLAKEARGPIYLHPAIAGGDLTLRSSPIGDLLHDESDDQGLDNINAINEKCDDDMVLSSLKCLTTMFLLGFAVPEHVLNRNLIGGRNTVDLLERLGLAFRMDAKVQEKDEVTINAVVPFVHVFPLDINHPLIVRESGDKGKDEVYKKNQNNFERQDNVATLQNGKIRQGVYSQNRRGEKKTRMSNILLITDLHPSALGTTNVGNINDDNGHDGGGGETVMYVGPDSLALIRHLQHTFFSDLRPQSLGKQGEKEHVDGSIQIGSNVDTNNNGLRVLDLCTGCGIQAISALAALDGATIIEEEDPKEGENSGINESMSIATIVDFNKRALRFASFNVLLNGIDPRRVKVVHADLLLQTAKGGTIDDKKVKYFDKNGNEHEMIRTSKKIDEEAKEHLVEMLLRVDDTSSSTMSFSGEKEEAAKNDKLTRNRQYDLILANPPFVPTPSTYDNDDSNIIISSPLQSHITDENIESSKVMKNSSSSCIDKDGRKFDIIDRKDRKNESKKKRRRKEGTEDVRRSVAARYGAFSSGGVDGEDILKSIVTMSPRLLGGYIDQKGCVETRKKQENVDCGMLAIVSEFMNPPPCSIQLPTTSNNVESDFVKKIDNDNGNKKDGELLNRIKTWWRSGDDGTSVASGYGILFTNKLSINAAEYASRRAHGGKNGKTSLKSSDVNMVKEIDIWQNHLESRNIQSISPGLLFIRATKGGIRRYPKELINEEKKDDDGSIVSESKGSLFLGHMQVPTTDLGSIWTPHNFQAVKFTSKKWKSFQMEQPLIINK